MCVEKKKKKIIIPEQFLVKNQTARQFTACKM